MFAIYNNRCRIWQEPANKRPLQLFFFCSLCFFEIVFGHVSRAHAHVSTIVVIHNKRKHKKKNILRLIIIIIRVWLLLLLLFRPRQTRKKENMNSNEWSARKQYMKFCGQPLSCHATERWLNELLCLSFFINEIGPFRSLDLEVPIGTSNSIFFCSQLPRLRNTCGHPGTRHTRVMCHRAPNTVYIRFFMRFKLDLVKSN